MEQQNKKRKAEEPEPVPTIAHLISLINTNGEEFLSEIEAAIKSRKLAIGEELRKELKKGDRVTFKHRGDTVFATITGFCTKNIRVDSDCGTSWTISPHLLKKV